MRLLFLDKLSCAVLFVMLLVVLVHSGALLAGGQEHNWQVYRMKPLRVIYIPGWLRSGSDPTVALRTLQQAFPNCTPEFHPWDGDQLSFGDSRKEADVEGRRLGEAIAALPPPERELVVLVGHSLGARVAAHAGAVLSEKKLKIGGVVLIAAAVFDDEAVLKRLPDASLSPVVVVACQRDPMLKYAMSFHELVYGTGVRNPLGLTGWRGKHPRVISLQMPAELPVRLRPQGPLMNYEAMRKLCVHLAEFYLVYFREQLDKDFQEPVSEVILRQPNINLPLPVIDAGWFWNTVHEQSGWKLQEHRLTGHYRIVDPNSIRRAWGTYMEMKALWTQIPE